MSGIGSTNIDDLPGPEEQPGNYEQQFDDRTSQIANMNNNVNVNLNRNVEGTLPRVMNSGGITANIHKKKERSIDNSKNINDSYYDIAVSYITKENILLLAILYLTCLRQSDEYTRRLLINLPFNLAHNVFASNIIKCLILLIIYLIVKEYI